jgi:hypothetical protein
MTRQMTKVDVFLRSSATQSQAGQRKSAILTS